jgi:hypothetical protein
VTRGPDINLGRNMLPRTYNLIVILISTVLETSAVKHKQMAMMKGGLS